MVKNILVGLAAFFALSAGAATFPITIGRSKTLVTVTITATTSAGSDQSGTITVGGSIGG